MSGIVPLAEKSVNTPHAPGEGADRQPLSECLFLAGSIDGIIIIIIWGR